MTAYSEKRSCNRCPHQAPIQFSYFNQDNSFGAHTINHSISGMCFKSKHHVKVKSTILIRTESYASDDSCSCAFEGLPSISLGEIKWCREISDAIFSSYEIGVKYHGPDYQYLNYNRKHIPRPLKAFLQSIPSGWEGPVRNVPNLIGKEKYWD